MTVGFFGQCLVSGWHLPCNGPEIVAPRDLHERTRQFALANYRAARKGRSRAEFEAKLGTVWEEADECVDWLEYLRDMRVIQQYGAASGGQGTGKNLRQIGENRAGEHKPIEACVIFYFQLTSPLFHFSTFHLSSNTHSAAPRSGGFLISGTRAGNVATCAPPLPTVTATYCLPPAM